MDYQSNQDLFRHFNSWKTNTPTCDQYQQKQALRIQQIQRQDRVHQESLIRQAERLLCAERARCDAVSRRLGFSTSYSVPPAPPPLSKSPQFSARFTRGNERHSTSSPDSSLTSVSTLSPVDTHTPSELMFVYPFTPVPSPPPSLPKPIESQFPVLQKRLRANVSNGQSLRATYTVLKQLNERHSTSSTDSSLTSVSTLSPLDTDTQSELMFVYPFTPVPTSPPSVPKPKESQFPVLQKRLRANISNGHSLRATYTVLKQLLPSTQTPIAVPKPPTGRCPQERKAHSGRTMRSAQGDWQAKGITDCASEMPLQALAMGCTPSKGPAIKTKKRCPEKTKERKRHDPEIDFRPLLNPAKSLTLAFDWLESEDWQKKIDGLKTFQSLVRYHQNTMLPKLREICLVLVEEIKNLRSAVACAAINVMADFYVYLKSTIDLEVELTCRTLLLRLAQGCSAFIQERVNLALDALVENCNHKKVVTALLNTGMSPHCIAVRTSIAEHLKQVLDKVGTDTILSLKNGFTEGFLIAVSKMAVDAAPNVRYFGVQILEDITMHRDFLCLWEKNVPLKDRRPVDKIFKKLKLLQAR